MIKIKHNLKTKLSALMLITACIPLFGIGLITIHWIEGLTNDQLLKEVGLVAESKHLRLNQRLSSQKDRFIHFIIETERLCNTKPKGRAVLCFKEAIQNFKSIENATDICLELKSKGIKTCSASLTESMDLNVNLKPQQIALVSTKGKFYQIPASVKQLQIIGFIRFDNKLLNEIFDGSSILGEKGETFLADLNGFFISKPKYQTKAGHSHGVDAMPMLRCLSGGANQEIAPDYRSTDVIHGYRQIPEIGGGCIMAHFDKEEAFVPIRNLIRIWYLFASLIFIIVLSISLFLSNQFIRNIIKPIQLLQSQIKKITSGDLTHFEGVELTNEFIPLFSDVQKLSNTLRKQEFNLKKADEISKNNNIFYNEILNTTGEGFWILDISGNILDVNKAYCDLSGYSRDELLLMNIEKLEGNETGLETKVHIQKIIKEGFDRFETRHRLKNGELIDVEISVSYVPMRNGILTVFVHDISDRTRMMKLLTTEKNRAENLAAAKTKFLSTMSHEIRTPLGGILGVSRLLLESAQNENDLKMAEGLNRIVDTTEGLNTIVNEILESSRIESGKIQLESREFQVVEIVDSLSDLFKMTADQNATKLEFIVDPKLPSSLIGDAFRIKQVLTNLIGNAIKFTKAGQIKIELRLEGLSNNHSIVMFSVMDTGIGMDASSLANLTMPFVQADNSVSRKYGGTGLGLYISKNLLKLMDSDLEVESELGKGSIFRFKINLRLGVESLNVTGKTTKTKLKLKEIFKDINPQLSGKKILIAEDDMTNQLVISSYLKFANIKSVVVNNGEECLELIHASPDEYQGILMDINMPVMSGVDATERIRKFNHDIPIIALTAAVTDEDQAACVSVGMTSFLMKPIDPVRLVEALNKFCIKLEVPHLQTSATHHL